MAVLATTLLRPKVEFEGPNAAKTMAWSAGSELNADRKSLFSKTGSTNGRAGCKSP